ncbi:MAG: HpcH/HpaI aldolase/citrate lyase family protein [Xanthobacteraceae bacterium]
MTIRPRRSVLYMPGANVRAIDKARGLPVDAVIIDLEDAVAPEAKAAARDHAVEAMRQGGFGPREVLFRINGFDTPWFIADMQAVVAATPDGIVVPKIASPQQLVAVGERLLDMHADRRVRVWAMIETPLAILNIREIAGASEDTETRLTGLIIGTNDLAKETRVRVIPGRAPMLPWLSLCVLAARAYGLDILDGVYNDFADVEGFRREGAQARDLGFDGKTLIHPNQVAPCNEIFSPSANEVLEARKIIAAFALPENQSKGVIVLDGRMVERMHADTARRTVAIAEAIAARG